MTTRLMNFEGNHVYQTIAYEANEGILTLTLNRPDQLNAFTVEMADELVDAFGRASQDNEVGAVVVTGAGRAFCAGMDLSVEGNVFGLDESLRPTLDDMNRVDDPVIHRGVRDTGGRVALAIYDCLKPVIGAVNGPAVGVGATMLLPMDIRLASTKARIGFVFGKIGITPEATSTWFLPRIVGMAQALEWVYSAEILTADDAKEGGLVSRVYSPDDLLEAAHNLARRFITGRSMVATALTRQMMYRNSATDHPMHAHKIESLSMFYASVSSGKEGVQAFLEKRDPCFTDEIPADLPPFVPWWT